MPTENTQIGTKRAIKTTNINEKDLTVYNTL